MTLTRNLVETESRRRELLHRLLRTSEHQRAELAGDLHDGPIQMLTVAAMRLEHLGMVEEHPPAWLPDAVQTVRDTVVQLRDVLVELHPGPVPATGSTPPSPSWHSRSSPTSTRSEEHTSELQSLMRTS